MAKEKSAAPYVFPGVWKFIEEIAIGSGRDLHQSGRTRAIWHVARVQDALGQIPRMDPDSQQAAMEQVYQIRESLALALEGVDAAIAEVVAECGIATPKRGDQAKPADKKVASGHAQR